MSAVTSPSSPRSGQSSADLFGFEGADELGQSWRDGLTPDPALTVSEWADRHRVLSPRASAEPGRYRTDRTPYIREIVDALSPMHPARRIVVMKSAQVGFTEGGNNWIGYVIHHAPGPMLAVQPTVELAKRFSRQRLEPLIHESPALRERVKPARSRDAGNTVLSKEFPAGLLVITGANSAVGLRSMPARYLFLDEVDAYPPSADEEGDPVALAEARTRTFSWRSKVLLGSTPTIHGLSRVEREYEASDQRRYFVPCPHCREMQWLRFERLRWDKGKPDTAHYLCASCEERIEEHHKTAMLEAGEWRATADSEDPGTIGFHISALYATNAIESWAGNVVGAGIKPSSLIKDAGLKAAVQELWLGWTDEADAEGFTDFYGLQRRAAREVFIAGEVFFRFRPRRPQDGLTVPLQLQMLPSEMLPLNRNEVMPGGNVIRQGIEFDGIGRRVAYHFLRRHPGDITDPGLAGDIVRVPAFEIIHVIDPVDAGQLRGVSRFAAGIVKLFLLDQYDDAELDRKKVAAMHALFITTPAPAEPLDAAEGRDQNDERTIDLQPGQITMLEPGEEVQTSAPADVGQTYEPFQYRTLLQVSAALGVPYAYLSNDMLKANYSNSRLALLEFRRRIEAYQHAVIVWQLCRQVWARWMDTAVLAGTLALPDYDQRRREYLACGWLPPKWDWVDPLKDARAEIEQIDAGLKSRTQALAERGYDAEQVDAEIAADKAREKSLGLSFGSISPSSAEPAPGDPADVSSADTTNPPAND